MLAEGVNPSGQVVPLSLDAEGFGLLSFPVAGSANLSNVAASASSVQLLAANPSRKGLVVHNDSTAPLYLKYGTTASATSFTHHLDGGAALEMRPPIYTGRIDAVWGSATGAARITELA